MAKSPDIFPRVYVAMVEAGEAGGFLDVVLAQIAEFQAREKDLKSKVHDGDDLSVHPVLSRAGGADGAADVFHSEIPEGFRERPRFAAVDHPDHHRRQPSRALLRIVRRGGSGGRRLSGAHLVRFRKRQAHLGRTGFEIAAGRPAHRAICHGALLPDARHAARRRRAAGAGPECRAQIHRQPDSRGRRRPVHRARAAGRTARPEPRGLQGSVLRLRRWK